MVEVVVSQRTNSELAILKTDNKNLVMSAQGGFYDKRPKSHDVIIFDNMSITWKTTI